MGFVSERPLPAPTSMEISSSLYWIAPTPLLRYTRLLRLRPIGLELRAGLRSPGPASWSRRYPQGDSKESSLASSRREVKGLPVFPEFLFPAKNSGDIALLFGFFDPALRLVEHGQTGMSKDVVLIEFDESFCGCNRFVRAPAVEKRHSQAMQGILVVGIDLQGLFIGFDGLVELVITERVNRGLEVFFLRHVWIL